MNRLAPIAAALLLPAVARAQQGAPAAVAAFDGPVAVEEASGARRALAAVPGTDRVANGTLAAGDVLVTAPGAAAAVRLADGGMIRAGASTRMAVSDAPVAEGLVRRSVRLDAGRLRFDVPARDGILHEIAAPPARLALSGAQGSIAWNDNRLRVAIDGGRAELVGAAGRARVPVGVGQAVELRPAAEAGGFDLRAEADGSRPVRVSLGVVRIELTAGDAIRVAPRPDGAALVTVLSGPVVVTRGETAPPRTADTGESFPAEAAGIEMPEIKPLPPKPAAAPRRARSAADDADQTPVPPIPDVPYVRDTVEASPMD